jgi:hypothetical protein
MKFVTAVQGHESSWVDSRQPNLQEGRISLSTLTAAGRSAGLASSDCPYRDRKEAVGVAVTFIHLVPLSACLPTNSAHYRSNVSIARVKKTVRRTVQYRQKDKHDEPYTKILSMRPFHLTDPRMLIPQCTVSDRRRL